MLKKYLPLIIIFFSVVVIAIINSASSKFLIGWDNLLPELNIWLNLKRSLFSVWQEHQGLGLLAGNGHAAELPYQIYLLILSIFMPLNFLRQFFIFLMLFFGAAGTYYLIKNIVGDVHKTVPLLGSFFYLLNLSTVQVFYVPFEPFMFHYAFLPWLITVLLNFLKKQNLKNLALFILLNILAIPQSQVPTVFFVYTLTVFLILLVLNLKSKTKAVLFGSLKSLGLILIINAFWLLPFLYFSATNSQVAFNAKINQMASETNFLQNKEFGHITDVALLKGFWFNNVDPNFSGNYTYMFAQWREFLAQPWSLAVGYILFAIIIIGVFASLKTKRPTLWAFVILFFFSLTMLTTATPPFSWINNGLRLIPLFSEVFRFPFTKFSILASLAYSVFFSLGAYYLILKGKSLPVLKKVNLRYLSLVFFALVFLFTFPVFTGHLFYEKTKINIPSDYFNAFKFFNSQNPNTRIADFPQYTFWGWNYYSWGYGGSGFLWYGINQPIVDRAFDVWSRNDENYYWELSDAIYAKNTSLFETVLNKYQINFLFVDKNIIDPTSPQTLFTNELESMLNNIPSISKTRTFGNLDIYSVHLKDNPKNFVFIDSSLPTSNAYTWGNLDLAYLNLGSYISLENKLDFFYLFRSLFTNKQQNQQEFSASEQESTIDFTQTIPDLNSKISLNIPSIVNSEDNITGQFVMTKNRDSSLNIDVILKSPEIFIKKRAGGKEEKIADQQFEKTVFTIPQDQKFPLYLSVNDQVFKFDKPAPVLNSALFSTTVGNVLVLSDETKKISGSILSASSIDSVFNTSLSIPVNNLEKGDQLIIKVPKIANNDSQINPLTGVKNIKNCDNFRKGKIFYSENNDDSLNLGAKNATACVSFYLSKTDHNDSYIAFIKNKNITGRGFHFWVLNEDEKFSPIDTYLDSKNNLSTIIIPPQEKYGQGYSLHFESQSIGDSETINSLGKISIFQIPFNYLSSIYLSPSEPKQNNSSSESKIKVYHPNESVYKISIDTKDKLKTIILSQSFDHGWSMYKINNKFPDLIALIAPFFIGSKVKNHVLVNNWENGWTINESAANSYFIIIYLPQYLEYLGIILALGTFVFVAVRHKKI